MATGERCTSIAAAQLDLPCIPTAHARSGHIMPQFKNNLLSLGKLCDANCTIFLDRHKIIVSDSAGHPLLTGARDPDGARLWRINITATDLAATATPTRAPPPPHLIPPDDIDTHANTHRIPPLPGFPSNTVRMSPTPPTTRHARAYDLPSVPHLIAYLHAAAGYPVKSTWLTAIKRGAYASWLGLTPHLVARYCPNALETHRGHMAQPRQHIRSSQPPKLDVHHGTPAPNNTSQPTVEIHEVPLTHLFTDDTGRFHPRALSGNQYVMIGLHSTSNAILVRPFASKHNSHRIPAYADIFNRLATAGMPPTLHIMDNESSAAFQRAVAANNCKLQLVPPHVHRRNTAERAIHTFKDHFLAILAGMAPSFPANRWDLLLPHAELTLNPLRPTTHPTASSAWEALFGTFNFDATPLAPAGCEILIHNKPSVRRSWDYRVQDGHYIGPALQHYQSRGHHQ